MFFIMGINQGRKDFAYDRMVVCDRCGSYGRYQVFMTYLCFSFFFLPIFKWNKEYYVQTTCCGTVYALDPQVGRRIAAGEDVEILPQHLSVVQTGNRGRYRRCSQCGYETWEDFEYCPKCGRRF